MGILGLGRLIADIAPESIKEVELASLFGRRIAIDASMSIYQFLIAIRNHDQLMTNDSGETTSHLVGLFYRTIKMLESGIKPVYVFDGKAPKLKSGELLKRADRRKQAEAKLAEAKEVQGEEEVARFNKRMVRVTRQHNEDCKKLLRLLGLPIIESPSEAEAQCAQLCREGLVYAAATEDMDCLSFGSPKLVRNLTTGGAEKVKEYTLDKVLSGFGVTQKQFIDLGILMGCDYCESIKGIGGKKGLELIKNYGSIEEILEKKFGITEFIDVEIDYGERKEIVEEVKEEKDENGVEKDENGVKKEKDENEVEKDNEEKVDELNDSKQDVSMNGNNDGELSGEESDGSKNSDKDGSENEEVAPKKKKKGKDSKSVVVPQNWLFTGARKLFETPNVIKGTIQESDLKQKEMDEEGIIEYLCVHNGFSEDRIRNALKRVKDAKGKCSQTRIDSFFKMKPATNTPSTKKVDKNDKGIKRGGSAKGSASKRGRKPK